MHDIQWPEPGRNKRSREADDAYGTTGFTEHRCKRLHSLPLRTTDAQKRWSMPNFPTSQMPPTTITPSDSDSEDVQGLQLSHQAMFDARDTDMMVDGSPLLERPEPSLSHAAPSIDGRMPTPINCSFAAQVRGSNWAPMNQATQDAGPMAMSTPPESGGGFARPFPTRRDPSRPRTLEDVPEWTMVQNRRLPSPISENGGETGGENGGEETPASPGMMLDSCAPTPTPPRPQRPYLPHMPHSMNPHAMALHPNIRTSPQPMDTDSAMMDTEADSPSSAPATPSPRSKFGHSRSKHTLNNWTLQPGMKKSFSIGYRADCEKCRMKIPGHFNHIIIS
ncbi:hypothetical protein GGR56DRAFT_389592 [Xylariaceae sp. FL0804]|nr:hypothetical protein GGR56DRAFT_389592 [Xylariaceae sp. FL0804]